MDQNERAPLGAGRVAIQRTITKALIVYSPASISLAVLPQSTADSGSLWAQTPTGGFNVMQTARR